MGLHEFEILMHYIDYDITMFFTFQNFGLEIDNCIEVRLNQQTTAIVLAELNLELEKNLTISGYLEIWGIYFVYIHHDYTS